MSGTGMNGGGTGNEERGIVAIIGLGLIGGSIARRLSQKGWSVGWVDPAVDAASVHEVDRKLRPLDGFEIAESDLVVLATPAGVSIDLIEERDLGDVLVTSVCSIMRPLVDVAKRRSIRFVAGHPMAGREVTGWAGSTPDLFEHHPWFRSADRVSAGMPDGSPGEDIALVDAMITDCGAVPVPIDPAEHDRQAALASHLPQLLSSSLAAAIDEAGVPEPFRGPGLKTFLRLAGSDWSVWESVLEKNADAVREARLRLEEMMRRVESGEGEEVFRRANEVYRGMNDE